MKRLTAALACVALLLVAAPAAATPKPLHYSGETAAGQTLSLTLQGRRVAAIDGSILTTCVSTHGSPVTYTVAFDPPGSFALGAPASKATKWNTWPTRAT